MRVRREADNLTTRHGGETGTPAHQAIRPGIVTNRNQHSARAADQLPCALRVSAEVIASPARLRAETTSCEGNVGCWWRRLAGGSWAAQAC
jgi:hypothetical protein